MEYYTKFAVHSQPVEEAARRRSRIVGDIGALAPLLFATAIAVMAIYAGQALRNPVVDAADVAIVSLSLGLSPLIIGMALTLLRDHQIPLTAATFVSFVVMAAIIAALSASRLFVSYFGILLCLPVLLTSMIFAATRLQKRMAERVAIFDFPGQSAAQALMGTMFPVIGPGGSPSASIERVLIDIQAHHSSEWAKLLVRCYVRDIEVTPWITFLETRRGRVELGHFDLTDVVLTQAQTVYLRVKRLLDLVFLIFLLPLLLPLGLLTWAYVWAQLGRDTIFVQERRGLGGKTFNIFKFRTMRPSAADASVLEIIPSMGLVRRFRLDELPQVWNIIVGNMSWIGPRPATLAVAAATERVEPKYAARQVVRPGLSGWAQINAGYAATTEEEIEKLAFDLFYVKRISFDLDIQILFRTLAVVLFGPYRPNR